MARIRSAKTCRTPNSQAWARYSRKKPKKNYIKALPHTSLLIFKMGKDDPSFDTRLLLVPEQKVQLRSNALEAARQVANKYLEANILNNYFFRVMVFPHNVIREHKMASGAGADRISKGMSLAFGTPVSVAARVNKGQPVFMLAGNSSNKAHLLEAFRRASRKLSGTYKIKAA
ncbi:MAG: 50S ribosomal protein L16 [Candidatus Micrarchaeaceae archaeon]